jgi:hypothetical protein
MSKVRHFYVFKLVGVLGAAIFCCSRVLAELTPATQPSSDQASRNAAKAERQHLLDELRSGDADRVAAAIKQIHESALNKSHGRPDDLKLLIDTGHYDEVESDCMAGILVSPTDGARMAEFEGVRARNFLAQGKTQEALAAAKADFDSCSMKNTGAAIALLCDCLSAAYPNDGGIVLRFKEQQMTGASTQPSTQPADDLGPSILDEISIDSSQFQAQIDAHRGGTYSRLEAKGNLLLISGRAEEARTVFEQALNIAKTDQRPRAIEDEARAIRAQSGCVGPANAYIQSLTSNGL